MTPQPTAEDRERAEKIVQEYMGGLPENLWDGVQKSLCNEIAHALASQREEMAKKLEKADPLMAECDWEQSDDIAYAVQKYLVKLIRTGEKGE